MKLTLPPAPTRLTAALAASLGLATLAGADTIKTKDGKTYDGTITAEDATSVTIKYMLTPKIPDIKIISKADIAPNGLIRKTAEDGEAEDVKKLVPTPDFLTESDYKRMIENGPAKFLAAHPGSKYAVEIGAVKKTLEEEMLKVRGRMRKVDGKWITAQEMQANEYNITALGHLQTMKKLAADALKYREALLEFVQLETTGRFSVHYSKAIDVALGVLDKYAEQLQAMIKGAKAKIEEADGQLRKMNPDQRKDALAERAKVKADFMTMIGQEKKERVRFTSISEIEVSSLQEALRQVNTEKTRLAAVDRVALATVGAEYERVLKLMGDGKYDEAAARLDEFMKKDKIAATDKDVKAKAEELKKLIETARREARQKELLDRTQPKPADAPKPGTPPAPTTPATPATPPGTPAAPPAAK